MLGRELPQRVQRRLDYAFAGEASRQQERDPVPVGKSISLFTRGAWIIPILSAKAGPGPEGAAVEIDDVTGAFVGAPKSVSIGPVSVDEIMSFQQLGNSNKVCADLYSISETRNGNTASCTFLRRGGQPVYL
jgi:hypothetical protein